MTDPVNGLPPTAVTQVDVAQRAGVSRALVSLVMRGSPRVADASRDAVMRAAEELGYRPNAHAAQLASHRSRTLGALLVQLDNPLFPETLQGLEETTDEAQLGLLLKAGLFMDVDDERAAIRDQLSHRVDGIVLVSTRLPASELRDLAERTPVVTVFRKVPGVDSVLAHESAGASLVMDHLLQLGHRDIAHVDARNFPGSTIRRTAYLKAMRRHGLDRHIRVVHGGYTEPGGYAAARELLADARRPSALFCANDLMAVGALGAAKDLTLAVPTDVSIAGFDNTVLSAYQYLNLTTVDQPSGQMGSEAVRLLVHRISNPQTPPQHVLLPPDLVVRTSTGPPSPNHRATRRT